MFIFGVPMLNTTSGMKWHLHCGDFRADPLIICEQTLSYFEGDSMPARRLHFKDFLFESIYLDTTYAHPKHSFPPQNQVISACVEGCRKLLAGACVNPQGQRLLVPLKWVIAVGSYLIGKERIILALAIAFDLPIYADSRKRSILGLLNWPELEDRLTDDPLSTPLHLVSMSLLGKKKLSDYMESFKGTFTHILGIRPTGWTFDDQNSAAGEASSVFSLSMPKIDGNAGVWPVPYSEHSSYRELDEFLKEISFHQLIPTVDNWGDVVLDSRRSGNSSSSLLSQWSLRRKPNKY
jgi:DNA cross-link repair 1A protein